MTKNWFITGVSTGFGKHLAELALAQGDKVAATFRKQEQADEFSTKAGANGKGLVADVADEAVGALADEVLAGTLDPYAAADFLTSRVAAR